MTEKRKKAVQFGILFLLLTAICVGIFASSGTEAASLPKPSVTVTKRTKTTATIKIAKKGNVTGYQIWLSTSKNGKYKQVDGIRAQTCKLKKLKSSKAYYVKVRAFRTTNNYRITYGKFSAVVKIGKYQKPKSTPKPTETPMPTVVPDETDAPGAEETAAPDGTATPGTEETAVPDEAATPEPEGSVAPEETKVPVGL